MFMTFCFKVDDIGSLYTFNFSSKHYENMPMQYTEILKIVKNENFQ